MHHPGEQQGVLQRKDQEGREKGRNDKMAPARAGPSLSATRAVHHSVTRPAAKPSAFVAETQPQP